MVTNIEWIKLRDYGDLDPRFATYMEEDRVISCAQDEAITNQSFSFKIDVRIRYAHLIGKNVSEGDQLSSWVQPKDNNGIVGTLDGAHAAGATIVKLSLPQAIPIYQGCVLRLGSEAFDYLVQSFDALTNEATLVDALQENKAAGATVEIRYYTLKNILLRGDKEEFFRQDAFGSQSLDTNTAIVAEYVHVLPTHPAKNINVRFMYFYGNPQA